MKTTAPLCSWYNHLHIDQTKWGVGVANVIKASALHVETVVVGVRVLGPAKGKTHIGQTPAQKVPQLCGRISVEDRRCKAELDL